jgi:hypothetical protein
MWNPLRTYLFNHIIYLYDENFPYKNSWGKIKREKVLRVTRKLLYAYFYVQKANKTRKAFYLTFL